MFSETFALFPSKVYTNELTLFIFVDTDGLREPDTNVCLDREMEFRSGSSSSMHVVRLGRRFCNALQFCQIFSSGRCAKISSSAPACFDP